MQSPLIRVLATFALVAAVPQFVGATMVSTGDLGYNVIYGGISNGFFSVTLATPNVDNSQPATLSVKYGLWDGNNDHVDVSLNASPVGSFNATNGYISPGPMFINFDVTGLLNNGNNLIAFQGDFTQNYVVGQVDITYAVPEPSFLAVLGVGAVALARRSRKCQLMPAWRISPRSAQYRRAREKQIAISTQPRMHLARGLDNSHPPYTPNSARCLWIARGSTRETPVRITRHVHLDAVNGSPPLPASEARGEGRGEGINLCVSKFDMSLDFRARIPHHTAALGTTVWETKYLMKKLITLLSTILALSCSANIVGYYNLPIYPGDNLVANQLYGTNDTLNGFFSTAPVGTIFTKWDSAANQFKPISTFNGSTWSINYSLTDGEGGVVRSASLWTNTFVGEVHLYTNLPPLEGGPLWAPGYANGLHLLSSPVPLASTVSNMFYFATGRSPNNGEWVGALDPATQTYTISTFDGSTWDNPNLFVGVGQSAWFNLGPVESGIPILTVPEPSFVAVGALAATALLQRRRRPLNQAQAKKQQCV